MPKTRLHANYVSPTKKAQAEDDSIMDDFQMPDDLRKNLDYCAQQKKTQLRQEHADKKLTARLEDINTRLKADRTKVSCQRIGDSLYIQATLPLKPDESSKDGSKSKQTKISLGIPFNEAGLKTIEEEARELGTLIARKTFQWNEKYLRTKATTPEITPTISELLAQFEGKYFSIRKRNRQSESTFKRIIGNLNRHIDKNLILDEKAITKAIEETEAGTGCRVSTVSALSVFCNTFKFKFNFKGYRDGYEPDKRSLPTDKEIEERIDRFKPSKFHPYYQWQAYRWAYGILATYGLRPHELFAIDVEHYINPANTMHELKLDETITDGIKTGERIVFPLHPRWVELFELKNVRMPKGSATFDSRTQIICTSFARSKIGFPPYNLRHAFAVRGHALAIPLREMADNMGHTIEEHTKTYQRYMTTDTRRIVYKNALNKAETTKHELTELEAMRIEIATLKAQNEELRALLVQHQLDGLLSQ